MSKWIWILLNVLLLIGCSGGGGSGAGPDAGAPAGAQTVSLAVTRTAPLAVARSQGAVTAEAVIEPARWSELSFERAGQVSEVRVAPGEQVAAGDLLVRLSTTTADEIALQSARQAVVAQQAALDAQRAAHERAVADATHQAAQAQIALETAQTQWEQAQALNVTLTVTAAQASLRQLQLQLAQTGAADPALDVSAAELALTSAQANYEIQTDPGAREQAAIDVDIAQAQLEVARNAQQAHLFGLGALQAGLDAAEAGLAGAQEGLASHPLTLQILDAQVRAAQLERDHRRALAQRYQAGGYDAGVTQAEAQLQQAQLAVDQLELQMQEAQLRAPFAGTVVEVHTDVGERAGVGQVVVVLATLDRLQARTVALSELDVARVAMGQPAKLTVDALPGHEYAGVVCQVALRAELSDGVVAYPVEIALDDLGPATELRWGMTTVVQIDTTQLRDNCPDTYLTK